MDAGVRKRAFIAFSIIGAAVIFLFWYLFDWLLFVPFLVSVAWVGFLWWLYLRE